MPKYRQDDTFKLRVKKLAASSFIRVSDMVATFKSLPTSFLNDELRLLAYFENTWIGQSAGETPSNLQYKRNTKRKDPELGCLLSNNMM